MKIMFLICLFSTFAISTNVSADCLTNDKGEVVCGEGKCEKDQYGKVYCTSAGGGILRDDKGNLLCGVGRCAADSLKKVWCSKQVSGGAAIDSKGNVKCLGGCAPGSAALCTQAKAE